MNEFLLGMMATACWVAALYFLRFWRDTGDRLFALFAGSFALLGVTRLALAVANQPNEFQAYSYWMRLVAFLLILVAIVDKNRRK